MLHALQAQDAHLHDANLPLDSDPGDLLSSSSSFDHDEGARKHKKKKRKKGPKAPYKVKKTKMRLPQFQNALTFQPWRHAIRTGTTPACDKLERARAFIISVGSEDKRFHSLPVSDVDRHGALDLELAHVGLKIVVSLS